MYCTYVLYIYVNMGMIEGPKQWEWVEWLNTRACASLSLELELYNMLKDSTWCPNTKECHLQDPSEIAQIILADSKPAAEAGNGTITHYTMIPSIDFQCEQIPWDQPLQSYIEKPTYVRNITHYCHEFNLAQVRHGINAHIDTLEHSLSFRKQPFQVCTLQICYIST